MTSDLEELIKKYRDELDATSSPSENHEKKFLFRLGLKFREIVSIAPYLVKLAIITVVIFIASIIIWNNFIRKDRHEVTLKQKIENAITPNKNKR